MNIIAVNKEENEIFEQIRRRIRRLQNWGNILSLERIGVPTERQVGASIVALKELASHYAKDKNIALMLWQTEMREEQIIGIFLLPKDINKEIITQLLSSAHSYEIAEIFGAFYLTFRDDITEIVPQWCQQSSAYFQISALSAGARHLLLYKAKSLISKVDFIVLLQKKYEDKYVQLIANRYMENSCLDKGEYSN